MATLPTRSFDTIVANIVAGMQGRATALLDFSVGSVLRAMSESIASLCLWFQSQLIYLLAYSRLSTSVGSDVDSFIAQFFYPTGGMAVVRLGAVSATGPVVFSVTTPNPTQIVIPVGTTVQTKDLSQQFTVYADTTNPAYNAALGGYVLAPMVTSVTVPVKAVTPGSGGNVAIGAISTVYGASILGIDSVTNTVAFSNGLDEETDQQLINRFRLAIASLSKGTVAAYQFAIASLQVNLQCTVQENTAYDGTPTPGLNTVVVDDGSGAIPSALVTAATTAVNAVRAASIRVGVYAATKTNANVVMTLELGPGYAAQRPTIVAKVANAVSLYISAVGLGNSLSYFGVAQVAMSVPGVTGLSSFTLNGSNADLAGTPTTTIKPSSVVIS